MAKRTLGFKLTLGGILAMVIPLAIVGSFSLFKASSALQELAKGQANQIARNMADMVDVAIKAEIKVVANIAGQPYVVEAASKVSGGGDKNAAAEIGKALAELARLVKQGGNDYETVFVTDASGVIFADGSDGKLKGTAMGDRDYIKEAKAGKVNVGAVTKSRFTGNPVIPIAAPIYNNGQFIGSVVIGVRSDFLAEKMSAVKLGKSGYAWMIDKNGLFIYHPKKEYVLDTNMNVTSMDGMKDIVNKMVSRQAGVENYVFQGVSKIAGYAPVQHTAWSIAFTQNDDDFLASVHSIRNFILIVGFICLALTILAITFFSRTVTSPIKNAVDEMGEAAGQVTCAASQVSSSSQSLAEGASEQASAIEETSSSLEEMSSMTKRNAENAGEADGLMKQANKVIDDAKKTMDSLTKSMMEISTASEETSKIIKTIDEIAFQTNLLALNAAVEAARAGEAGAGFAVVADEVRNLAIRAADAAKNTSGLIEGTVTKIRGGSELVVKTNQAFANVSESASKVGGLVGEIAAACEEQSHGIDQINKAVSEMDKVIQSTAATAEESASASEELNAQAEQMKHVSFALASIIGGSQLNGADVAPQASPKKIAAGSNDGNERFRPQLRAGLKTAGRVRPEKLIPLEKSEFADF